MVERRVSRLAATAALSMGAVLGLSMLAERGANANPMDLAPERLVTCDRTSAIPCGGVKVNAAGTGFDTNYFKADNEAWAKLMSQYAMAMAPLAMHPARTTGYGGFELSLFGSMTTISKDAKFMEQGTEGPITDGNKFSSKNATPDSVLQTWGVTGRKGLPYGFELQGTVGYMANTEMAILGGGIRLAPFEGFRKYFDISAGGYVHTMTGTNKVKITVPAFDIQVSRQFVIAQQVIFQPYVGWQMVWLNVDSGVIDTTPNVDGLGKCNARPPTADERAKGDTGEFHCQNNSGSGISGDAAPGSDAAIAKLDLNNNVVFRNMRTYRRQRMILGLSWRWENLSLVLPHVMIELANPEDGAPDDAAKKRISGLDKQTTFGATVGLAW